MFELSAVELQTLIQSELEMNPILEEVEPLSLAAENRIPADLILKRVGAEYVVTINDGAIPRLRISERYETFMSMPETTAEVRDYIKAKIAAAKFLIRSLQQRRKVLLAIGIEIAKCQQDFFENRSLDILPMGLPQAALHAGLVGATASLTLSNKYIETPLGIFELARFFQNNRPN
jgi:RNA polymerase sigma-54 factor